MRTAQKFTPAFSNDSVSVSCNPGEIATGGGAELAGGNAATITFFEPGGIPLGNPPTGWFTSYYPEGDVTVRIHAVCLAP